MNRDFKYLYEWRIEEKKKRIRRGKTIGKIFLTLLASPIYISIYVPCFLLVWPAMLIEKIAEKLDVEDTSLVLLAQISVELIYGLGLIWLFWI